MALSERERVTILIMFGWGDLTWSHSEVQHLFNDSFPNRNPISKSTVTRTIDRLVTHGTVSDLPRSGRPPSATDQDSSVEVLQSFTENPHETLRSAAGNHDMSKSSVQNILHKSGFKPYKFTLHQELNEDDFDRRLELCEIMMTKLDTKQILLNEIVFSDEATFMLNGNVNKHNCRYWIDSNPHWMIEGHTQHPQKLNVWAGIVRGRIVGPFFIDGNLDGVCYLDFEILLVEAWLKSGFNKTEHPRTTGLSPVSDVRLRLRLSSDGVAEHQLRYRSLVVGLVQRSSSGAEWTEPRHCGGDMVQTQVDIAGRSSAVIVGVLEEPVFRKCSTISISGAIIYKPNSQSDGPDVQDMLNPEVHFNVEDLIQGNLLPFSQRNSPDESDLISVLVSSRSWQLSASPCHRLSAPLTEDLAKMGLLQVKELGCWFGPWHTGGSLAGLLVIESEITIGGHSVRVYAREMKQALQFVHSLFGKWKIEVCKDNVATVQDCIQNLSAELCTLHSIARPNAEYSSTEWDQIRDKLNKLELATDLSFMSHLSL